MRIMDRINDHLVGAVIVSVGNGDDEGMHIVLNNGYCLVIFGTIGLVQIDNEKLH